MHGVGNPYEVVRDSRIFLKEIFYSKNEPKIGFFEFIENFGINFSRIWSIMKVYIICYILAQIPYLGKTCVPWCFPRSQNALGQSDCKIFKSNTSLEQNDEIAWFFTFWYKFMKIESWSENIAVSLVKNGGGHSGQRTLKLPVSQERINGISWFFECWYKLRKASSYYLIDIGWALSKTEVAF